MRVAILDDYQNCIHQLNCFSKLAKHDVVVFQDTVTNTELAARLQGFDAVVLTRERTAISASLLDQLPTLKLISQTGKIAGHVDLAACTARGVAVSEGQGTGAATAELTWALILASRRHLLSEARRMQEGLWQGHLGQQLSGQRLGVWGYGRIGRQVAFFGRAFGMQVWVWGREGSMSRAQADGFELAPSRADFLADSDVLSLHIRLNDQTRGLVTVDDLTSMKTSALWVNTSRAELVAPGALVAALQSGRPGFAAVDVYESEPVLSVDHPILKFPNALCTPHIGYVERDNYEHYFGMAFDNVNAFAEGKPQNLANSELVPSFS